jgi:RNA polymerase sigma factor (sigma-70 family)
MENSGAGLEALEVLYRTGFPSFVRAAGAIAGEAVARDVVQEAFAQAVKKRSSFKREAPLEAWVWRIVINQALELRRRRTADLRWEAAAGSDPSANGFPGDDAAIRSWIGALPERQRLAVFLRYFADLDYRSIAAALEVEVGTVSATLAAAHAALRRSYTEVVP